MAVAAVALLCAARTWDIPALYEHAAVGRAIAAHGISKTEPLSFTVSPVAWAAGYGWGYDRAVAALAGWIGVKALSMLHVALYLGCLAFWLTLAAREISRPVLAGISALLLLHIARHTLADPRPELMACVCATFMVAVLRHPFRSPWMRWACALPIQLIWANTAPYALAGPLFATGMAGDLLPQFSGAGQDTERSRKPPLPSLLMPVALLAACMATPAGIAPSFQIFFHQESILSAAAYPWSLRRLTTVELFPLYLTLAIYVGCLLVRRQRLPTLWMVSGALGIFLSMRPRPDFYTAVPWCLPFLAVSLDSCLSWFTTFAEKKFRYPVKFSPAVGWTVMGAQALIIASTVIPSSGWQKNGQLSRFGFGPVEGLPTPALADILKRPDAPKKLLHAPQDGGPLAWMCPDRKIFADTRPGVYPVDFQKALARWMQGEPDAHETLMQKWDIDGVLIPCFSPAMIMQLRPMLEKRNEWTLAWFDGARALVVRKDKVPQSFWGDRTLQQSGLQDLDDVRESWRTASRARGPSPVLIGAGMFFLKTDRPALAADCLDIAARHAPALVRLNYVRAMAYLQLSNGPAAEDAIRKLLEASPEDAQAWMALSRAQTLQGLKKEAKESADIAMKYAPAEAQSPAKGAEKTP